MSRISAGLLHRCDAAGCTAKAFTPGIDVPADWARREAVADGQEHTNRDMVGIDLCNRHVNWHASHEPLLPGFIQFEIVGDALILSRLLACSGCDWATRPRLPTGSAEERSTLLSRAWLDHLSRLSAVEAAEVLPLEAM